MGQIDMTTTYKWGKCTIVVLPNDDAAAKRAGYAPNVIRETRDMHDTYKIGRTIYMRQFTADHLIEPLEFEPIAD